MKIPVFIAVLIAVSTLLAGCDDNKQAGADAGMDAPDGAPQADSGDTLPCDRDTEAALAESLEVALEGLHAEAAAAALLFEDGRLCSASVGTQEDPSPPAFRVGSITKTFTAALVLALVDDGVLGLDDVLARWLPDMPNAAEITIRHLLQHRSGLGDYLRDDVLEAELGAPHSIDELIEIAAAQPLVFDEPGSQWDYSNTNYLLLGRILEDLLGRSYEEALHALLAAQGLGETFFVVGAEDMSRLVPGFAYHCEGSDDACSCGDPDSTDVSFDLHPSVAWAAGGLASTAPDLVRWLRRLVRGEVLPADATARMLGDRVPRLLDGDEMGLGLMISTDHTYGEVVGHEGGLPGYGANVQHLVEADVTLAVMVNATEDCTEQIETLTRSIWAFALRDDR